MSLLRVVFIVLCCAGVLWIRVLERELEWEGPGELAETESHVLEQDGRGHEIWMPFNASRNHDFNPISVPVIQPLQKRGLLRYLTVSAFWDRRELVYGARPSIAINVFHPKENHDPEHVFCVLQIVNGSTLHLRGVLDDLKEIGHWCPAQVRCNAPPSLSPREIQGVSVTEDVTVSPFDLVFIPLNVMSETVGQEYKHASEPKAIGVCMKALYFKNKDSIEKGFVEWIEYYRLMGARHIVLYDTVSSSVSASIIRFYRRAYPGFLQVIPWSIPPCPAIEMQELGVLSTPKNSYCQLGRHKYVGFSGQLAAQQDCMLRLTEKTDHIFFVDIDEYIRPASFGKHMTFQSMLKELRNRFSRVKKGQLAGYHFGNVFAMHCGELNNVSLKPSNVSEELFWGMTAAVRDQFSTGFFWRNKFLIDPFVVKTMHVHWPNTLFISNMASNGALSTANVWWQAALEVSEGKHRRKYIKSYLDRVLFVPLQDGFLHHSRRSTPSTAPIRCTQKSGPLVYDATFFEFQDKLVPEVLKVIAALDWD